MPNAVISKCSTFIIPMHLICKYTNRTISIALKTNSIEFVYWSMKWSIWAWKCWKKPITVEMADYIQKNKKIRINKETLRESWFFFSFRRRPKHTSRKHIKLIAMIHAIHRGRLDNKKTFGQTKVYSKRFLPFSWSEIPLTADEMSVFVVHKLAHQEGLNKFTYSLDLLSYSIAPPHNRKEKQFRPI